MDDDVLPNDVDNCCRITVSKSDRDLFISDFGLSFSLPPETTIILLSNANQKPKIRKIRLFFYSLFTCDICFVLRKRSFA